MNMLTIVEGTPISRGPKIREQSKSGAVLGLPSVDLVEIAERLAVVGDQGQVNGQSLEVLAE
jgi:hypothetical protein